MYLVLSSCLIGARGVGVWAEACHISRHCHRVGNPSCAPVFSTGQVSVRGAGQQSAIMVNQFKRHSWGTWKSLTGTVSSDPSMHQRWTGKVYWRACNHGDCR